MALDPAVFHKAGKRMLIEDDISDKCPKTLHKFLKKGSVWESHGEQLASQSKHEAQVRANTHLAAIVKDTAHDDARNTQILVDVEGESRAVSEMNTGCKDTSRTELKRMKSGVINLS